MTSFTQRKQCDMENGMLFPGLKICPVFFVHWNRKIKKKL